jgi:4-hydroxyphenylpyruvate dioxygenase
MIAEIFEPEGIRVGIEPIAFPSFSVWSLEGAIEVIAASGVQSAVLVADVYNLMMGESTVESMRRYGKEIGMIHVNDAPEVNAEKLDVMYTRRFPGEGILEPAEWVRAAIAGGFTGPVSMEIFMKDLWEMELRSALGLCLSKMQQFALAVG